jgi:hypothetical protein
MPIGIFSAGIMGVMLAAKPRWRLDHGQGNIAAMAFLPVLAVMFSSGFEIFDLGQEVP